MKRVGEQLADGRSLSSSYERRKRKCSISSNRSSSSTRLDCVCNLLMKGRGDGERERGRKGGRTTAMSNFHAPTNVRTTTTRLTMLPSPFLLLNFCNVRPSSPTVLHAQLEPTDRPAGSYTNSSSPPSHVSADDGY